MFSLVSVLLLLQAHLVAADVPPCPPPESPASSAPPEIFSVSKSAEDGLYEYTVLIDLQFKGYALDGTVLAYISDDDILLMSNVAPLHLETQAAINFSVAQSIARKIRLFWTYRDSNGMCPESVSFQYQFQTN